MDKGGRPRAEIDWDKFDELCRSLGTIDEVAAELKVSRSTMERACKKEHGMVFTDLSYQRRLTGILSVRQNLFNLAMAEDHKAIPAIKTYLEIAGVLQPNGGASAVPVTNIAIQTTAIASGISTKDLLAKALDRPKMITEGNEED